MQTDFCFCPPIEKSSSLGTGWKVCYGYFSRWRLQPSTYWESVIRKILKTGNFVESFQENLKGEKNKFKVPFNGYFVFVMNRSGLKNVLELFKIYSAKLNKGFHWIPYTAFY